MLTTQFVWNFAAQQKEKCRQNFVQTDFADLSKDNMTIITPEALELVKSLARNSYWFWAIIQESVHIGISCSLPITKEAVEAAVARLRQGHVLLSTFIASMSREQLALAIANDLVLVDDRACVYPQDTNSLRFVANKLFVE